MCSTEGILQSFDQTQHRNAGPWYMLCRSKANSTQSAGCSYQHSHF
jgi:hypothetical protein